MSIKTEPHYCIDCGREIDASPTKQCADCRSREAYFDDMLHAELEGL